MRDIIRFLVIVSVGTVSIYTFQHYYPNTNLLSLLFISYILQVIFGYIIFPRVLPVRKSLYDIIAICPERRHKGEHYCGVCPQGYECAKRISFDRNEK